MNQIQLVDLHAQYEEIKEETHKLWEEILESMYLYLGPNVQKFEKEFALFNKVKYCVGVGTGTEAVHLAIRSLGIGEGDEIITPSHTFFATIEAIIHAGTYPVLIDIDPQWYTLSPEAVLNYIESYCIKEKNGLKDKKTGKIIRAILPVHLYGHPADMDALREIADEYNLMLIEDSAQAHGAEYKGKKAGALGDVAAFSFYFSKNLGAFGEGGAVTTSNEEYANRLRRLREHGQKDKYHHESIGYNSRLDELQAAVLRCKLKLLNKWNDRRRDIASFYNDALNGLPLKTPTEAEWAHHVYHLYVVRSTRRDELFKYLKEKGIGCGIHYPIPCHLQEAMKKYGYKEGDLPQTEKIAKEVLSLPMHPHLREDDTLRVVKTIREFYE
ncbi:DegT/DnrJ/EryC1/StrS family aminotransferase [candidate division WOR-3 bacterium]|nr:DegT/DnrJ/EryC1/StrS family aminotransferase [candidate division WOR-3 bacterium]